MWSDLCGLDTFILWDQEHIYMTNLVMFNKLSSYKNTDLHKTSQSLASLRAVPRLTQY